MSRTQDVREAIAAARSSWPVGTRLAHYKGGTYIVVGHGFDTDRQEANIHYERRAGPDFDPLAEEGLVYDRPLSDFIRTRFTEIR